MSLEEQEEFDCDIKKINWPKYFENYQRGIQIYVLGQDSI
jgi:hypothetical protein